MPKKPFWEETYGDKEAGSLFGKPSNEFYSLVNMLPKDASILDLGSGDGRNALFLAENGFRVKAVDISVPGMGKLRHQADLRSLNVETGFCDMREYEFRESYDLIVSHGCLHLIERHHWMRLIRDFKEFTKPGGFNVITVFTDRIPPPDDLKDFMLGLFFEGELFGFYQDWEIQINQSYIYNDEHPGSGKHSHPINKIVASKP